VVADDSTTAPQAFTRAEVKAHHWRPEGLDQVAQRFGKRRSARAGRRRLQVDANLRGIGRKRAPPALLAPRVGRGWPVAEEIDRKRPVGAVAQPLQFAADRLGRQHGAGQRAQAARAADRQGQRMPLDAGHRRLDDWQLGAQQRTQGARRHQNTVPSLSIATGGRPPRSSCAT
jgi:hypothetical protein